MVPSGGGTTAAAALIFPAGSDSCAVQDAGGAVGMCSASGRPQLPAAGFAYDPTDIRRQVALVAGIPLPKLLAVRDPVAGLPALVGCATVPMLFVRNSAAKGNGGAVYQAGCDAALDAEGVCFFTGLGPSAGAAVAVFEGNTAAGGGGGAYTECGELLPACKSALIAQSGLVGPGLATKVNNTAQQVMNSSQFRSFRAHQIKPGKGVRGVERIIFGSYRLMNLLEIQAALGW